MVLTRSRDSQDDPVRHPEWKKTWCRTVNYDSFLDTRYWRNRSDPGGGSDTSLPAVVDGGPRRPKPVCPKASSVRDIPGITKTELVFGEVSPPLAPSPSLECTGPSLGPSVVGPGCTGVTDRNGTQVFPSIIPSEARIGPRRCIPNHRGRSGSPTGQGVTGVFYSVTVPTRTGPPS